MKKMIETLQMRIILLYYSGMQGSVNGDAIGEIELLDCNGTDFCIKYVTYNLIG